MTGDRLGLGDLLRAARQAAGLSQADLAKEVDVTPTAVSYWETGARVPDFPTVARVARALDVPVCAFTSATHTADQASPPLHQIGALRTRTEALVDATERLWREVQRLAALCDAKDAMIRRLKGNVARPSPNATPSGRPPS